MAKKIVILAGPNGAGKTTFAEEFLLREANCPDFMNADLIARGLSPFAPESAASEAGKVMLRLIDAKAKAGVSFAFETTLSGSTFALRIPRWRECGFQVELHFLSLPSPELALSRVRARAAQGGHDVAEPVVRRRFTRGLQNFENHYRRLVNVWAFYDNSGRTPRLLRSGVNP